MDDPLDQYRATGLEFMQRVSDAWEALCDATDTLHKTSDRRFAVSTMRELENAMRSSADEIARVRDLYCRENEADMRNFVRKVTRTIRKL